jgi:hypothetical protein
MDTLPTLQSAQRKQEEYRKKWHTRHGRRRRLDPKWPRPAGKGWPRHARPELLHGPPTERRLCADQCGGWLQLRQHNAVRNQSTPLQVRSEYEQTQMRITAVPDNALRVSPQRTPTREKNRPAHCQQRTALVETPTEHKTTEAVPSPPLGRIILLATLALIVRQPPDQTLWPPHASGPYRGSSAGQICNFIGTQLSPPGPTANAVRIRGA